MHVVVLIVITKGRGVAVGDWSVRRGSCVGVCGAWGGARVWSPVLGCLWSGSAVHVACGSAVWEHKQCVTPLALRLQGVTFLKRVKEIVEDPRRLLLEV